LAALQLKRPTDRGESMLKSWMRDITLAAQARSGVSPAVIVWIAVVALAALTAFVFLCVAAYDGLKLQVSSVFAGLIMAGVFILIALLGVIVCTLVRRRARERAILARAARAHASSWLLDPKIIATAMQIGRTLGWQRVVPVALLGFMVAQWAREHRGHESTE
jgi:hypothetical protein